MRSYALAGGYDLEHAGTAAGGLKRIQERRPDLALLDLGIADMPGLDCLKLIRHNDAGKDLPVIVAGAAHEDSAVVEAFNWGADDFVLVSCEPTELLARMRAVLRRRFQREENAGSPMTLGEVSLDPARHLCLVRGKEVKLKPRDFALLEILMRKAGRVLSRGYLLETIWGLTREVETRSVDVAVFRLRKSLGPRAAKWVETIERYGYRFRGSHPAI